MQIIVLYGAYAAFFAGCTGLGACMFGLRTLPKGLRPEHWEREAVLCSVRALTLPPGRAAIYCGRLRGYLMRALCHAAKKPLQGKELTALEAAALKNAAHMRLALQNPRKLSLLCVRKQLSAKGAVMLGISDALHLPAAELDAFGRLGAVLLAMQGLNQEISLAAQEVRIFALQKLAASYKKTALKPNAALKLNTTLKPNPAAEHTKNLIAEQAAAYSNPQPHSMRAAISLAPEFINKYNSLSTAYSARLTFLNSARTYRWLKPKNSFFYGRQPEHFRILRRGLGGAVDGAHICAAVCDGAVYVNAYGRCACIDIPGLYAQSAEQSALNFTDGGGQIALKLASAGAIVLTGENPNLCERLIKSLKFRLISRGLRCAEVKTPGGAALVCAQDDESMRENLCAHKLCGGFLTFERSRGYYSATKLGALLPRPGGAFTPCMAALEGFTIEGAESHNMFVPANAALVFEYNRLSGQELESLKRTLAFCRRLGVNAPLVTVRKNADIPVEIADGLQSRARLVLKNGKYSFPKRSTVNAKTPATWIKTQQDTHFTHCPPLFEREYSPALVTSMDDFYGMELLRGCKRRLRQESGYTDTLSQALRCMFWMLDSPKIAARALCGLFELQDKEGGIPSRFCKHISLPPSRFATLMCAFAALSMSICTGKGPASADKTEKGGLSGAARAALAAEYAVKSCGNIFDSRIFVYAGARCASMLIRLGLKERGESLLAAVNSLPAAENSDEVVRACFSSVFCASPADGAKSAGQAAKLISRSHGTRSAILAALLENCIVQDLIGLRARGDKTGFWPLALPLNGFSANYLGKCFEVRAGERAGVELGGKFYANVKFFNPPEGATAHIII